MIRRLLGIKDMQDEIQELREEVSNMRSELEDARGHTQSLEEEVSKVEDLSKDNLARIRDLEPVMVDLTNRQREALEVFLSAEDNWIDVRQLSERLETSRNNAGSILSDLKKKIDFDIKTVDHGRKLYQLPESEKDKIFQNSR